MTLQQTDLLHSLNHEQKIAASFHQGPLLILAGAGSGKTKTITHRMAFLIKHYGAHPESVLGITFTNKAASEMKDRVKKILGREMGNKVFLSTFHSLGLKILKEYGKAIDLPKNFALYDASDQHSLIREGIQSFKGSKDAYDRKLILGKISKLKNLNISPNEFGNSAHYDEHNPYDAITAHVYDYYQRRLAHLQAVDFDDLLLLSMKILKDQEKIREEISNYFKYITVDEYQDTNPLQFTFLKLLLAKHQNLCVVGDDDQSIYAFRGADSSLILNFKKYFADATVIKLEQNYRSTNSILNLANAVIAKNSKRHDKKLWSELGAGVVPEVWGCGSSDHGAAIISEDIKKVQDQKMFPLSEIAILCRSNAQFHEVEHELTLQQISYEVFGGQKVYEKKEVKDILAYLKVISQNNDEVSFRRICNVPARGIGEVTIEQLSKEAKEMRCSLFQAGMKSTHKQVQEFVQLILKCKKRFAETNLNTAIEELITEIKYDDFMKSQYQKTPHLVAIKKQDIQFLINMAARQEKQPLYEFLNRLLLQEHTPDNDAHSETPKKEQVSLMTLHSSKGLEFEKVYILGAEEQLLPHARVEEEGGDIEEERRLFYVGITRAKKQLIMTYAKSKTSYQKVVPRKRTRFLEKLEGLFVERDCTTLGHLSADEAEKYKADFFQNLGDLLS